MIRERFALVVAALSAGALTTLAGLAMNEPSPRSIDITVLWLAGALTLGMVVTWAFILRLPRWIVAGWGLILIATGIGEIITAPVPAGAGTFPWALAGLVVFGIVTILSAVIHGQSSAGARV